MANIYRNALSTIAAAAASDHSQGCFTERRPGPSCGASPLDSRAWILQEQILSPRILKYSLGQLTWECISSSVSERGAVNATTIAGFEILRFKRALGGFRSTSMSLGKQAHASWQQIVESQSCCSLTDKADKLMAVMGVARFTGNIMQDTFLAGLWEGQLWRDLLWISVVNSHKGRLPERLKNTKFPSWSWASVDGPVSYQWPAGSSPAFVVDDLELVRVDVDQEISNRHVHGMLVVKG